MQPNQSALFSSANYFRTPIRCFFCLGLLLLTYSISSQTLSLGLLVGGSNYQGDLASTELSVITQQTDVAFGGFLRYQFNESFSLKLQLVQSTLRADDANSSIEALRQRNLRFFSPILDTSLRLEWYPFVANSEYQQSFLPYVSLGGSYFTFNPQAEYEGRTYELQPLRTEGQGLASFPDRQPYSLSSGSLVGGVGFKIPLNEDLTVGLDVSFHYAFTDYLDDVSTTYADFEELATNVGLISAQIAYQVDDFFELEDLSPLPNTVRGNPKTNDFFMVAGVTLSYYLVNPDRGNGRGIGCPTF
ncbi:MAG: DUF6089 family protein [Bacteroidota bacterium]